jgi:hypothetical protein
MKRVLVFEDKADNLRLIAYALEYAGYEFTHSETGGKVVDPAIRERPFSTKLYFQAAGGTRPPAKVPGCAGPVRRQS